MSVDTLQEKIRKTKNPSVLQIAAFYELPQQYDGLSVPAAMEAYTQQLLLSLKGIVPAVRFGFGSFALLGAVGLSVLENLTKYAHEQGYYVLLDAPELLSPMEAENAAKVFSGENCPYYWDGLVLPSYLGSDVIKPFVPLCKKGKALFPVVRTANKTASEIQDLLTGGRLVHTALADIVSRQGEGVVGKCGYSQMGALAAASAADSLRSLRGKYSRMFLLLDGYDYPNANAKNCSYAFDKLGHGAAACAGSSVFCAWKEAEPSQDPVAAAVAAAERMKKNLTRYICVL